MSDYLTDVAKLFNSMIDPADPRHPKNRKDMGTAEGPPRACSACGRIVNLPHPSLVGGTWCFEHPAAKQLELCRACSKPLRSENIRVADGCPCNSPRGVNHGLVPTDTCTCVECDPEQTGSTRSSATPTEKGRTR